MSNRLSETGQILYMPAVKFILIISLSILLGQTADSLQVKNPKTAGYMGLIFPGGGQIYNGRYLKAGLIMSLEVASYLAFRKNRDYYNDYANLNLPLAEHRYLEKRNKYAWWMGILYIYGVLDAIVDAHLHQFDLIMEENLESNQTGKEEKQ